MNYFELYDDQEAVLDRIEQLKYDDYYEEDIHLLGRDDMEFKALDYTEVNFHSHITHERGLREILSNNETAERFLNNFDLGEDEIEKYLFKISEGNYLIYYDDDILQTRAEEAEGTTASSEADLTDNHDR
ncbi:general stress protein [Salinicoccus carnicancri]|uniref:general stress protein n=1 Tax=Salinicoccus carnicancri TaxID=558170 RepID=UPI0002DBB474|nr:general stress protein [Salinicoccus carnicancri]